MLEYPRDQLLRLLIYSIYTNSLGDLIQVKDLNTIHLLMASKHRVLIQTSVEICVSKSLHIISCSMSHRHQKLKISKAKLLLYSLITQLLHNVISILPFPHAKRFCSHSTFLAHRVPSMRNLCRLPLWKITSITVSSASTWAAIISCRDKCNSLLTSLSASTTTPTACSQHSSQRDTIKIHGGQIVSLFCTKPSTGSKSKKIKTQAVDPLPLISLTSLPLPFTHSTQAVPPEGFYTGCFLCLENSSPSYLHG